MNDLNNTLKINMLLDFYSTLLTAKQLEYMELYYKNDYSLAEIASIHQVSRNAVYDSLQRTTKQLDYYEESLQMYQKFVKRKQIYGKIKKEFKDAELQQLINTLENLE